MRHFPWASTDKILKEGYGELCKLTNIFITYARHAPEIEGNTNQCYQYESNAQNCEDALGGTIDIVYGPKATRALKLSLAGSEKTIRNADSLVWFVVVSLLVVFVKRTIITDKLIFGRNFTGL